MLGKCVSERGKKWRGLAAIAALSAGLAACADGVGPETARVRVLLTDAPSDMLDSAHVWISHVYLQGGGGEEPDTAAVPDTAAATDTLDAANDRVDLFNDPDNPHRYDLLQLRDGLTADLTGQVEVHAGIYQGLRLVVDSAKVTLAEGWVFQDSSSVGVLDVPSGSKAGIKVKLSDVLRADGDDAITIVVDFDVDENFVIQTDAQTGRVRRILFTPVLREKSRQEEPAS